VAAASKPVRLAELAAVLGREFEGDPLLMVSGVAALETAGPGDIAFVRSLEYSGLAATTRAGALILPADVDRGLRSAIRSPNPALDFARVVERLAPPLRPLPGPHPLAQVAVDAQVDASASLGIGVVVGAGSRVGPRSVIHASVTLYPDVVVGADCILHSGVVLREHTRIGDRVVLQPGVVIGADGFGHVWDEQGRPRRVPHVGRVVVEDDVEIGANTTVDRATLDETRIRRGAQIDNLVQIAHNCDIGENAIVVAQTGLSGSTRVGAGAIIMAQAGSAGHLEVGERAFVGARAGLHKDVAPGARVWGSPQMEERGWHRSVAALARLPGVLKRLRAVERRLGLRPGGRPSAPGDEPGEDAGES
jgi:UDP-3-O-[3-hydroxymyristoyl] glucosamine N-acyltransferase